MEIWSRRIRALLACGSIGGIYGSTAGAIVTLLLFPMLTVVGAIVGGVGGFLAGIAGAITNTDLGWAVSGFLGGFLPGCLFWPDLELVPMWFGGGCIGAIMGTIVAAELKKSDPSLPLTGSLRSQIGKLALESLPLWQRAAISIVVWGSLILLLAAARR